MGRERLVVVWLQGRENYVFWRLFKVTLTIRSFKTVGTLALVAMFVIGGDAKCFVHTHVTLASFSQSL